jgi:ABC-type antimicrobial peptide transport system permease subunit
MITVFFVIITDYERKTSQTISSTIPPEILIIDLKGEKYEGLKNEISQLSQVKNIYATNWLYDAFYINECTINTGKDKIQKMLSVVIDPQIIDNEIVKLKAGRNFPKEMPQNVEQFILVNEDAAKLIKTNSNSVIGQMVTVDSVNLQILGIMPNQIVGRSVPIIYRYLPKNITSICLEIQPKSQNAAILAIQKIWKKNFPNKTASILNLKDRYSKQNAIEIIGFFGFFAVLVMIIACLGILGIASYAVEVRTKELGIRKVLGANKLKLIWTISKNFGILLVIGGIIGIPAGFFCGKLLRDRMGTMVDLSFINLFIGFLIVSIAGILSVLSQTIRAGNINVVKVLKAE